MHRRRELAERVRRRCARGHRTARGLALAAALVVVAGCGSSGRSATGGGHRPEKITVLAAASLTEAFRAEVGPAGAASPPSSPRFGFGGSGALAEQVLSGAPADVIATADEASMDRLVKAGAVEPPAAFATNSLEIVVAAGNPHGVTGLADLASSHLIVVLCDTSVPAGRYARQALDRAGVVVHPASLEPDVKAAVTKVSTGEADAAVVYVTDVRAAGSGVEGVEVPAAQNLVATYPVAVVKGSAHAEAARGFVSALMSSDGRAVLARHGFGPPPP